MPGKIFLNFDFYGSGNIGDDLMLDGFLKGMEDKQTELYNCIPRDSGHLQKRFPEIKFYPRDRRNEIAGQCDVWAGIGDTPIQVKSGDWFLKRLEKDVQLKGNRNIKFYFVGIGAEREALCQKEEFRKIINEVDFIWTRDKDTTELLINDFKTEKSKVRTSSDLANISLKKYFSDEKGTGMHMYDLGLCYYDEQVNLSDIRELKKFLRDFAKRKKQLLLFCNEVKTSEPFEYFLYSKMFSKFERYFNRNISFYIPPYFTASSNGELISPYSKCKTVISSRYHALLTAAWAGCRLVSLERSSKVSSLANELGIEEVKKPFTCEKLIRAYESAKTADMLILNKLYDAAISGVTEFIKSE